MSLKYVVGFFDPTSGPTTTHYDVYYDTVLNTFSVAISGPDPQNPCNLANAGYTEGEHITGADTCSDNPNTSSLKFYFHAAAPYASVVITPNDAACPPVPPPDTCDIEITLISVSNETASGANDGTATINASTTHGPTTYSLDGTTYLSGNVFTGLSPGNYTGYVKDTLDCTDSQPFTVQAYINPVQNFSDDLPVVTIPGAGVSRWNAAFNPIVVNYQRKDFGVTAITGSGGQIMVTLNTTLPFFTYRKAIDNGAYFKTALYEVLQKAVAYTEVGGFGVLTFNEPYVGDDTDGFLNINSLKPGYFIQTQIKYGLDPVHPKYILATHSPNSQNGKTRADLAPFLQTLLSAKDAYNYTDISYSDTDKAASFQITFREVWDTGSSAWYSAPDPLYVVFAAFQLGEKYGGNMAQYVPFMSTTSQSDKAKFLTDWISPIHYAGLPFDISFIYSEAVINEHLFLELIPDCGSTVDGLLLNADAGYVLNADTSRFIINRLSSPLISNYSVIQALGLTRCLIPDVFDCCAKNIIANIYYIDEQPAVFNFSLGEATGPFIDGNGQLLDNGTVAATIYSTGSGSYTMAAGDTYSWEAFGGAASMATNPKLRMTIHKGATLIYDNQIVQSPSASMIKTGIAQPGVIYTVAIITLDTTGTVTPVDVADNTPVVVTKNYIMQPMNIRNVCPCDDPYVYMKWVNSKGGWDYYRFGFNQFLNATVTNDQSVTKFIQDWANDDTLQDNVNKSSAPGLLVGASQVDNDTAYTLQWAKKSIRAMILVGSNPVKWQTVIVKDGDTDVIQTRKKTSDVSFKLILRSDNIQNS